MGNFLAGLVVSGLFGAVLWFGVQAWDDEADMRRAQVERLVGKMEQRP